MKFLHTIETATHTYIFFEGQDVGDFIAYEN
jgi:hypothetical protein